MLKIVLISRYAAILILCLFFKNPRQPGTLVGYTVSLVGIAIGVSVGDRGHDRDGRSPAR